MHEVQREGLDNRGSQTVRSLRWQRSLAQMSKKLRLRALYDAVRAVKGGGAARRFSALSRNTARSGRDTKYQVVGISQSELAPLISTGTT